MLFHIDNFPQHLKLHTRYTENKYDVREDDATSYLSQETRYMFHSFPGLSSARMDDLKMPALNNQRLGLVALTSNLHPFLRHSSPGILAELSACVRAFQSERARVRAQVEQELVDK